MQETNSGIDPFTFFDKGGFITYILLLLSIYVVTISILKIVQFYQAKLHSKKLADVITEKIRAGNIQDAIKLLERDATPLGRVLHSTVGVTLDPEYDDDKSQAEITRVGNAQITKLESHIKGMELVAQISPLLGLLGTVIGMVKAFARLEEAGTRVDPSILAGGIWEALLTTVAGLFVAIPALALYYILSAQIEKFRAIASDSVTLVRAQTQSAIRKG